jgi:hypothetical protein
MSRDQGGVQPGDRFRAPGGMIIIILAVDGDGDDRRPFVDRSTSRRKDSILVRRLLNGRDYTRLAR